MSHVANSSDQLTHSQRWDHRYATHPAEAPAEPRPFVTTCLPKLPARGRALDVAAGAGRHSLALAYHGLQVDAVDISWHGLRLAQQRARESRLVPETQIHFIVADVERPWLPQLQYDVILVSFFLYRPLFALIKDHLLPGGWLIYETLMVEQIKISQDDHPRREFLLEPGELKANFSDLKIMFYDEGNHQGRMTAQLLARKLFSRPNPPQI